MMITLVEFAQLYIAAMTIGIEMGLFGLLLLERAWPRIA